MSKISSLACKLWTKTGHNSAKKRVSRPWFLEWSIFKNKRFTCTILVWQRTYVPNLSIIGLLVSEKRGKTVRKHQFSRPWGLRWSFFKKKVHQDHRRVAKNLCSKFEHNRFSGFGEIVFRNDRPTAGQFRFYSIVG